MSNYSVFIFRRSETERIEDCSRGVSAFNGFLSTVNYTLSYGRAAHLLFQAGAEQLSLDEVGLPVFYLQRHTVELMLKDYFSILDDLEEYRQLALLPEQERPATRAAWAQARETKEYRSRAQHHVLTKLLSEVNRMLLAAGYTVLPSAFGELIAMLDDFEGGAVERARFHMVKQGPRLRPSLPSGGMLEDGSFDSEPKVRLPLGEIDSRLEALLQDHHYSSAGELEPLLARLGEEFNDLVHTVDIGH